MFADLIAQLHDPNFRHMAESMGATVTAHFGEDGITIVDPNRAGEGAAQVFREICGKAI